MRQRTGRFDAEILSQLIERAEAAIAELKELKELAPKSQRPKPQQFDPIIPIWF